MSQRRHIRGSSVGAELFDNNVCSGPDCLDDIVAGEIKGVSTKFTCSIPPLVACTSTVAFWYITSTPTRHREGWPQR